VASGFYEQYAEDGGVYAEVMEKTRDIAELAERGVGAIVELKSGGHIRKG